MAPGRGQVADAGSASAGAAPHARTALATRKTPRTADAVAAGERGSGGGGGKGGASAGRLSGGARGRTPLTPPRPSPLSHVGPPRRASTAPAVLRTPARPFDAAAPQPPRSATARFGPLAFACLCLAVAVCPLAMAPEEGAPAARYAHRVALFTASYDYSLDGVSLTLNRLVTHLERAGHDVRVLAPTRPGRAVLAHAGRLVRAPSVRCPVFGDYELTTPWLPARVAAELDALRPTVVHIATPDPLGHAALAWASARAVPAVCSFHTRYHRYLQYYGLGWLEGAYWHRLRKFHARCAGTYPPSEAVAAELRAHGVPRVRLWGRGVDTARFSPAKRDGGVRAAMARAAEARRAALELDGDAPARAWLRALAPPWAASRRARAAARADGASAAAALERALAGARTAAAAAPAAAATAAAAAGEAELPVLLLVSRLRWEKGLADFATVARAVRDVPHALIIVGDGEARRALQRRLPWAHFTGALSGEALARAYASADVFLSASTTEGFGGTVLEAMASGLPVAAFNATGITQVLSHGRQGLLAPAADTAQLAANTRALLGSRAERRRLGRNGRAHAQKLSWSLELQRMERLYDDAVDYQREHGGPPALARP